MKLRRAVLALCSMIISAGCAPDGLEVTRCTQTSGCDAGYTCVEGDCAKLCTTDFDCGPGRSCNGGICLAATRLVEIEVLSSSHDILSSSGFDATILRWVSSVDGHYSVVVAGDCATGTIAEDSGATGTAYASTPIIMTIDVEELVEGNNAIRICVTRKDGVQSERLYTLIRDESAPVTTPSPPAGVYATELSVDLTCADNCEGILYSYTSDPEFALDGTVATGQWWDGPEIVPERTSRVVYYRARDMAGNVEAVQRASYIVDPDVPSVSIVDQTDLDVSLAVTPFSEVTWVADRDVSYEIILHGSCDNGTVSNATNGAGSASNGIPVTFTINTADLLVGFNRLWVCVTAANGLTAAVSVTISRDDSTPLARLYDPESPTGLDPRLDELTFLLSETISPTPSGTASLLLNTQGDTQPGESTGIAILSYGTGSTVEGDTWRLADWSSLYLPENAELLLVVAVDAGEDAAGNRLADIRQLLTTTIRSRSAQIGVPGSTTLQGPTPDNSWASNVVSTDGEARRTWRYCTEGQTDDCVGATPCCTGTPTSLAAMEALTVCSGLNAVNGAAGYAGLTQWRLPTVTELLTLVDYSSSSPAADNTVIQLAAGPYWTSTVYGGANLWAVDMDTGALQPGASTAMVTCVNESTGGFVVAPTISPVWVDRAGVANLDLRTSLTWERCFVGRNDDVSCSDAPAVVDTLDATAAASYCQGRTTAAQSDWRLPTVAELLTLADLTARAPAIDTNVFPATPAQPFWSDTPVAGLTGSSWLVDFADGSTAIDADTASYAVRCVRRIATP